MMMSTLHYYLMLYHVCYSWVMQMLRLWLIYIESGAKMMKVRSTLVAFFCKTNHQPESLACLGIWVKLYLLVG